MQKINIIQFLPYFPPHKGGLETHAQERVNWRKDNWYWNVINVVFDLWYFTQKSLDKNIILLPALEIIPTFPFPKFWKKEFRKALKKIKSVISSDIVYEKSKRITITRTRFFTSSLVWWIFAKRNKIKRAHIEHGVDYVKMNAKRKEIIARIYDNTIWRRIFRNADQVIWISKACAKFANKFTSKKIPVIYRWIDFNPKPRQKYNWKKVRIWFVGRLVNLKWVDLLIKTVWEIYKTNKDVELSIVWDGEEKTRLERLTQDLKLQKIIKFLWYKNKEYIWSEFLPNIDIIVNPSYQEGLPTSVLEWLLAGCVVIATDVWGTREISDKKDLILVKSGDSWLLKDWLLKAIRGYKSIQWNSLNLIKERFRWEYTIKKYYLEFKRLWNE